MKWLITGEPGTGKTTLILKLFERLKSSNISCDGFVTIEIREHGVRMGFIINDLKTGRKEILASKKEDFGGPMLGSYHINIRGIDDFAVKTLERAMDSRSLIICDEIGSMELSSEKFKNLIIQILKSDRHLLATLHRKHINFANLIPPNERRLFILTRDNWNNLFENLYAEIKSSLEKTV
ncbi:MAG TPA: NTPase [Geobacterales bacterium]|nr:NTPase [Geobacterales bacterium]